MLFRFISFLFICCFALFCHVYYFSPYNFHIHCLPFTAVHFIHDIHFGCCRLMHNGCSESFTEKGFILIYAGELISLLPSLLLFFMSVFNVLGFSQHSNDPNKTTERRITHRGRRSGNCQQFHRATYHYCVGLFLFSCFFFFFAWQTFHFIFRPFNF